jgi:hypothetical protein
MAMALVKLLLVILAFCAIGYSVVMIDLPNGKYYWIAFEVVVALMLIPVAIDSTKRMFGGK